MVGINPFDQPGVETYKKEMIARLGRPSQTGLPHLVMRGYARGYVKNRVDARSYSST